MIDPEWITCEHPTHTFLGLNLDGTWECHDCGMSGDGVNIADYLDPTGIYER